MSASGVIIASRLCLLFRLMFAFEISFYGDDGVVDLLSFCGLIWFSLNLV